MTNLSFPFSEEKIRALKVGDEVLISGIVFIGRAAFTPLQRPNCERHRIIPAPKYSAHSSGINAALLKRAQCAGLASIFH